ncbi:uroporphyrinogen-III synthase [Halobacillus sp. H74]|uniref:uroporphyrinogen-III synthase n=1 Tax=Halobacillus sp. H74 TaxID=3457436 RepID=UPI003FCC93F1
MTGLEGKKVGIAADRSADSISNLVVNMGGIPAVYPIQGTKRLNEATCKQNVEDYLNETFDWVILTTGIGARTLADNAETHGFHDSLINKLSEEPLAIRGSKTLDWLKENGLRPSVIADDGTMNNLFERLIMVDKDVKGRVFLQAYNQDDAYLKQFLEKQGYSVYLSRPYVFEAPLPDVLQELKEEITSLKMDAVIFTSKTQVLNLFSNAAEHGGLVEAFNTDVLAVAVGKVTANELESQGINNVLQPKRQKMGAMVVTLDRYFNPQA